MRTIVDAASSSGSARLANCGLPSRVIEESSDIIACRITAVPSWESTWFESNT